MLEPSGRNFEVNTRSAEGGGNPEPVTVDRLQAQPHAGDEASLLSVRLDSPATPVVPEIRLPTTSIYGRERSLICRREISTLKVRRRFVCLFADRES